ncbi:MAG: hypothetical protein JW810_07025 [Sedimentisphaerales bacterium]|nr:hypothetical protein [Sedimentisphaerales bacterium]
MFRVKEMIMVLKWTKRVVLVTLGVALLGGLIFGSELVSYVKTSGKSVQRAFQQKMPIEFELQRAQDMLEDIIPEMQTNIRLIAEEEVEINALKADIADSGNRIEAEQEKITQLKTMLTRNLASYQIGGRDFSRDRVRDELAQRFDRFKEAEVILASKQRMLDSREKSLTAAMQLLERTRSEKVLLAEKIKSLESQHRLVQATSVGAQFHLDNSKLAQTEKLIAQIKKRLDVAERVLAHEGKFVETIPLDTINEQDLLAQIDAHFGAPADENEYQVARQDPTPEN